MPPRRRWACLRLLFASTLAGVLGIFVLVPFVHGKIYADKENKIYHREFCPEVKKIKERNLRLFASEPEAESRGFYPCKKCIPPVGQPSLQIKKIKKLSLPVARKKIYIGDRSKKIYHYDWCPLVKDIAVKEKKQFRSAKMAVEKGYAPCKECNPPVMFKRNLIKIEPVDAGAEAEELPPAELETSEEESLPEAEVE